MSMDWDKLRIFHAAAEAGSFTKAGDTIGLSQSAVSRQVGSLEAELRVPLFHRHARGLILTEQGEVLYRTARDVIQRLEQTRAKLADSREKPTGELRITANVSFGSHWLTPRLGEFLDNYPDIQLQLILSDDELDLAMRQADIAVRLRQPQQGDLIQRRLVTMHFHAYASTDYVKRYGLPRSPEELDGHRLLSFGGELPAYLRDTNLLETIGRDPKHPRAPTLVVNNLTAIIRAVRKGMGIAVMPDYLIEPEFGLVQALPTTPMPELECYLVFAEEMKSVARVQVFRDFLIGKAQRWAY